MDTSQLVSRKFIRADDLKQPELATILSEGYLQDSKFGRRFNLDIEVNSQQWLLTVNQTNMQTIHKLFGTESKNWLNKKVQLEAVNVLVNKEFKKMILLKPIEEMVG